MKHKEIILLVRIKYKDWCFNNFRKRKLMRMLNEELRKMHDLFLNSSNEINPASVESYIAINNLISIYKKSKCPEGVIRNITKLANVYTKMGRSILQTK